MAKLLRLGWILAFAGALLVYPAVWAAGTTATEAYVIVPHDPEVVKANKFLDAPDPKAPDFNRKVMEIYGNPNEHPDTFVFVSRDKFVHPEENPKLTLLPFRATERQPIQLKTLHFFAKWTVRGAGGVGVVLFLLWCLALRYERKPEPPDRSAVSPADRSGRS
jgi:hypothetical protein